MKVSSFRTVALLALAVVAFVSVVTATPALPHAFCGDVTVDGAPAPDGTEVSAVISEGTLVAGTQNPVATVGGSFGKGGALPLLVQGEIPDGAIVTFHVDGVSTDATAVFEAGGGLTTVQIEVVTGATPLPTTSKPVSSGGGGTTASSSTEVPEKTVVPEATGSEEGSTAHETPTSSVVATPGTMERPPDQTQTAAQTTAPREAPLVYAPIASIAGGILVFTWVRRQ